MALMWHTVRGCPLYPSEIIQIQAHRQRDNMEDGWHRITLGERPSGTSAASDGLDGLVCVICFLHLVQTVLFPIKSEPASSVEDLRCELNSTPADVRIDQSLRSRKRNRHHFSSYHRGCVRTNKGGHPTITREPICLVGEIWSPRKNTRRLEKTTSECRDS